MADEQTFDVAGCTRCGGDHPKITFRPIDRPIITGPMETMTHWGLCPKLNQPILVGYRDLSIHKRVER